MRGKKGEEGSLGDYATSTVVLSLMKGRKRQEGLLGLLQ